MGAKEIKMAKVVSVSGEVVGNVARLEAKVDNDLSIYVDLFLGKRQARDGSGDSLKSVVAIATMYASAADDCFKTVVEARSLDADKDLESLALLTPAGFSNYMGETLVDILAEMRTRS